MVSFTNNREDLINQFVYFYQHADSYKEANGCKSIRETAESYVDSQISMEKGMQDYADYVREVHRKNQRLLKAIKTVKGKTFHGHLVEFLKDCEAVDWCPLEIVSEPIGKHQKVDEYGREIRNEWVDQRSVGISGDSYEGTICIKIREGKYLLIQFSM